MREEGGERYKGESRGAELLTDYHLVMCDADVAGTGRSRRGVLARIIWERTPLFSRTVREPFQHDIRKRFELLHPLCVKVRTNC